MKKPTLSLSPILGLTLIGLTVLFTGCASVDVGDPPPAGPPNDYIHPNVVSTRDVDVSEWNKRIKKGVQAGEEWTQSPVGIAYELVYGNVTELTEGQVIHQEVMGGNVGSDLLENYTVTVSRDGFLDDAVSGDWTRMVFKFVYPEDNYEDGYWYIVSAEDAWRCRRTATPDVWQNELCN